MQRRHRGKGEPVPARAVKRKPDRVEIAPAVQVTRANRIVAAGFGAVPSCDRPRMPFRDDECDLDTIGKRAAPFGQERANVPADSAMIARQVPSVDAHGNHWNCAFGTGRRGSLGILQVRARRGRCSESADGPARHRRLSAGGPRPHSCRRRMQGHALGAPSAARIAEARAGSRTRLGRFRSTFARSARRIRRMASLERHVLSWRPPQCRDHARRRAVRLSGGGRYKTAIATGAVRAFRAHRRPDSYRLELFEGRHRSVPARRAEPDNRRAAGCRRNPRSRPGSSSSTCGARKA